jgi:hypothetical protein
MTRRVCFLRLTAATADLTSSDQVIDLCSSDAELACQLFAGFVLITVQHNHFINVFIGQFTGETGVVAGVAGSLKRHDIDYEEIIFPRKRSGMIRRFVIPDRVRPTERESCIASQMRDPRLRRDDI